jgi:outer membrane protein assembly factor BamE (lipoprotein component of BamABCDE complex)
MLDSLTQYAELYQQLHSCRKRLSLLEKRKISNKYGYFMKQFRLFTFLINGLSVLALEACSARIDQRGKMPEPDKLAQIKPGLHSKEDVLRLIGSPTNTGVFDDNSWFYIHKTTETVSFLEPKILDEEVIIIRFDKSGLVKEIHHKDGKGRDITPVKRITPAAGEEPSPLQQIFGHFGRFSKRDKKE